MSNLNGGRKTSEEGAVHILHVVLIRTSTHFFLLQSSFPFILSFAVPPSPFYPSLTLSLSVSRFFRILYFFFTWNKNKASLSKSAPHFLGFPLISLNSLWLAWKDKHSVWKRPCVALSYTQRWVESGITAAAAPFFLRKKFSQKDGSIKWGLILTNESVSVTHTFSICLPLFLPPSYKDILIMEWSSSPCSSFAVTALVSFLIFPIVAVLREPNVLWCDECYQLKGFTQHQREGHWGGQEEWIPAHD